VIDRPFVAEAAEVDGQVHYLEKARPDELVGRFGVLLIVVVGKGDFQGQPFAAGLGAPLFKTVVRNERQLFDKAVVKAIEIIQRRFGFNAAGDKVGHDSLL
jgi:hypothetical protein